VWSAQRKLAIVLESLQSDRRAAEICRREGLSPPLLYQWRKQLMASAESVFARRKAGREDPQIVKLVAENQRPSL
jgi:transposase-like protein